jgi:hypothetical protein
MVVLVRVGLEGGAARRPALGVGTHLLIGK